MHHIEQANISDAREILALQRVAYQSEAEIYPGVDLPPMTQTLEEMQKDIRSLTLLKATWDGRIIGSVRAGLEGGICKIGRLIVAPDMQRRGLGTRLMAAIEAAFPQTVAYELFTGDKSRRNLTFYQKLGYSKVRTRQIQPGLIFVFLKKSNPLQKSTRFTTGMAPGKPQP